MVWSAYFVDWLRYNPSHGRPVEGDGEEVEDGGGAAEDVAGGPHVTQERPEDPGATYLNQGKVGQLFYLITAEGKVQIN